MTCNIGKADRILRVALGVVLVITGIVTSGSPGVIMGIVGLIPLGTGLMGNCPAYTLFGINTCKPHHM
ncbi:MAG: DUF2892 domain-containing protein [Nitrospina sp.]|jgi:hypothetical protein|nr:DUF2892 domain-containing protein [Nitrospina sp.]MBT5551439.1 DUF2892 domain-containing protein [Nitrospina sp.]